MFSDATRLERIQAVRERTVFFVGGPAKSGTTWLQHLLDAHPQAACRGEGHLSRALLPMMKRALEQYTQRVQQYNKGLFKETAGFPTLDGDDLGFIVATTAALLLGRIVEDDPGITAVGEKTPANIREYPLLQWCFPESRLVCIVRDPRDAFLSNWHQTRRVNPQWLESQYGGSMQSFAADYGKRWTDWVGQGLKMAELRPQRVRFVRYEDLHTEPLVTLQPVFTMLGLDAEMSTVEACVQRASFQRLSGGRSAGQADGASFFRKGVVGDGQRELPTDAAAAVTAPARDLMGRFGYAVGG